MIPRAFFVLSACTIDGGIADGKDKRRPATLDCEESAARKPKAKRVELTSEQRARLAAFRATMKMQRDQWARMTVKEKREAEAKWELLKQTINGDRAGYRQVFVDD